MSNKNCFLFITTLEHLPWGGCEDLWFKTALLALEAKNHVCVLAFKHNETPGYIKQLSDKGARIFFLNRTGVKLPIIKRVLQKIFLYNNQKKVLKAVSNSVACYSSVTILVSQAGGFDFTYNYLKTVRRWLVTEKFNYHIVVQNVPDLGFTLPVLKLALQKEIYQKAKSVGFVSVRNKVCSERILASFIHNSYFINNPLNFPELPDYIKFPPIEEAISFAVVAALNCSHKGQDVLLQVLSDKKWRNRNWQLNLYGTGKDQEYLRNLTTFYHLENKVFFHGHVSSITEIWKVNHIHILPSLGEGTPLALIESMVCGRPAITTDVGGNCEYVQHMMNGFIADYPTYPAIDHILENAWKNNHLWEEMGKLAREKVLKNYDLNSHEKFYKIINNFKDRS